MTHPDVTPEGRAAEVVQIVTEDDIQLALDLTDRTGDGPAWEFPES